MNAVRHICLSGPMGSGKSTVGRLVSAALGAEFIDLDARVEARSGLSVAAYFAERGEAAFRLLETQVLGEILDRSDRAVIALGGGTVTVRALRRHLLAEAAVITLRADRDALVGRVMADGPARRPLLAGDSIEARMASLWAERAADYAECHAEVDTTGRTPEAVSADVVRAASDLPIVVPLGLRTYRVVIAAGARHALAQMPAVARASGVCLVTDRHVGHAWGDTIKQSLAREGRTLCEVTLDPGEPAKHLGSVEQIWNAALAAGLDRGALVIGLGGGVVGDLAGFAASTFLRGVAVGQLPTTLLAMVDSAIGGKTGFDRAEGKNLIGTFHQPAFVHADLDLLKTLPLREYRAGLAEVVKSAWIAGEADVALLEQHAAALTLGPDAAALPEVVRRAAGLKARIVADDEREAGSRAWLNLGHTLGHAIEADTGYGALLHGEAVSLGMVAAMSISERLKLASNADATRMVTLLRALGLPTDVAPYLNTRALAFVGSDKKRASGRVGFVAAGAPGCVQQVSLTVAELGRLAGIG